MEFSELKILEKINKIYQRWWLIAVAVIVGGVGGGIFQHYRPTVYDVKARFVVTVDFSNSGNLTPYNLDQAVGAIQTVFYAQNVLDRVVEKAQLLDAAYDSDVFAQNIRLERISDRWFLRVRDSDPDRAVLLVNLWAEEGYGDLVEAHSHAVKASILTACLSLIKNDSDMSNMGYDLAEICDDITPQYPDPVSGFQNQIEHELELSKGINSNLIFSEPELISSSVTPVVYQRNWLILAGMTIGVVLGVFLVFSDLFA